MRQRLSTLTPSLLPKLSSPLRQPARGIIYAVVALMTLGLMSLSAATAEIPTMMMLLIQGSTLLAIASFYRLLTRPRLQPVRLRRSR